MKTQGIDIDTTDAQQKVQQLAGQLQNLDADTTAKLGLDDTDFQSKLSILLLIRFGCRNRGKSDPNVLPTFLQRFLELRQNYFVKAGVNEEVTVNYTSKDKDATVKYKVDHIVRLTVMIRKTKMLRYLQCACFRT